MQKKSQNIKLDSQFTYFKPCPSGHYHHLIYSTLLLTKLFVQFEYIIQTFLRNDAKHSVKLSNELNYDFSLLQSLAVLISKSKKNPAPEKEKHQT